MVECAHRVGSHGGCAHSTYEVSWVVEEGGETGAAESGWGFVHSVAKD